MQQLLTLRDESVFPEVQYGAPVEYAKRITVKAVVQNEKGEFGFVTNPIHNFYLLPGGGADSENLKEEIRRECNEELGYEVLVVAEIGKTQEFRNRDGYEYETTCFFAKTTKKLLTDLRTQEEKEKGLVAVWVTVEEAKRILQEQVERVKDGNVGFYNTAFNILRDWTFFEEFLRTR